MFTMLFAAYVLGVVIAIPLGPVNVATMRRALILGFWPSVWFGVGAITADMFYISLVYVGLAHLISDSLILQLLLGIFGGLWLGWLGLEAIRSEVIAPTGENGAPITRGSFRQHYIAGVGITLFSPLTLVSWLALGGKFFTDWPDASLGLNGAIVIVAILAGLITWVAVTAAGFAWGRRWVSVRVLKGISVVAGAILLLFAASSLLAAGALIVERLAA